MTGPDGEEIIDLPLPLTEIEAAAYFAAAEAAGQGYDLSSPEEWAGFLRHVEGTARQYFIARGVDMRLGLRVQGRDDPLGDTFLVRAVTIKRGQDTEIARWDIPTP
jgi:hypothetical protein